MPRAVYNRLHISPKIKKSKKSKVEKLPKAKKMKFCRECATGNQGENCPTACKGAEGCACLTAGCCKPGKNYWNLIFYRHGRSRFMSAQLAG